VLPEAIPASVVTLLNDIHILKPLVNKPECNIKLASPEDIAAMKVVAITQRGTAKDFFDLNALMQTFGMTLDYLISLVQKKSCIRPLILLKRLRVLSCVLVGQAPLKRVLNAKPRPAVDERM